MDAQTLWDRIYTQKAADQVSWFRPHLEPSVSRIEQTGGGSSASIIDVGAGESTLSMTCSLAASQILRFSIFHRRLSRLPGSDWAMLRKAFAG